MAKYYQAKFFNMVLAAAMLLQCCQISFAQVRIVGAIAGTITDMTGAAVPGAKVILKDEGTGIIKESASNAEGNFTFPDLSFGKFEITVSVAGFQTTVVPHIEVQASQTTDVPIKLQIGKQTESVTVEATSSPILETTSNLIANTADAKLISELPVLGRSVLVVARFVPGASPPDQTNSNDARFNNMPGGSINVTYDGINNASNGYKSGGTSFYATAPVRPSAVEEVSVETSGLGADSAGMSGTNIKMVTKRGTGQYHGSVFYQPSSEIFNANTWLRNATGQGFRTRNRTHNFGGNFGGRLLPGTRLKDKFFFFVNIEDSWQPSSANSSKVVLDPAALQGTYMYQIGNTGTYAPVNLFQVAAANGYPTTINPVIQDTLSKENNAIQYGYLTPINNNFNEQQLNWVDSRTQNNYYITTRFDYYITPSIQLTGTWNINHGWNPGSHNWPGPDAPLQNPYRIGGYYVVSGAVNWTISPRTFNEFRYGVQHSGDSNAAAKPGYAMYNSYNGQLVRIAGLPIISPYISDTPNVTGRHKIVTAYDTATMIRGNHTLTFGGQYRQTVWNDTQEFPQSPLYTGGYTGSDPMPSIFNATSMPGANTAEFGNAAQMYSLLVGRLFSISQTAELNPATLQYNGDIKYTWTASHMGGLFLTDRWRIRPNLTFNLGFRWEIQGDQYNVSGITAFPDLRNLYGPSLGLFQPGVMSGNNDPVNYTHGHAFKPDWVNPAPTVGFAWNPKRDQGWLGKLLGGSKTVIRGSYSLIYYDEGTQMFAAGAGNNPGQMFTSSAVIGTTTPYNSYLLNYAPGALPAFPVYNSVIHQAQFTFNSTFTGMNPNLRAPYTSDWNFGIQRQLRRDTVLEVSYVGNEGHRQWRTYSLNEVNIFENGFLNEFKNAQNNLKINQANGISNSFANNGLPGQVPLPIFQAAFGPIGSMPAVSNGSGFGSTGFITNLQNGAAGALANTLATNSTYVCHMFGSSLLPCATRLGYNAPGAYPTNFFLLNPFSPGALNYVDDRGWNDYHGLHVQVTKRFSHGLTWMSYYTFSKGLTNTAVSSQNNYLNWTTLRNERLDRVPSPFDIRQVFQNIGTYDLPIGKNRLVSINNRILDSLVGGWTWGNILTIRSGQPVRATSGTAFSTVNANDPGIILATGVTVGEIQSMMVTTQANNTNRQTLNTALIGPDGRANPQYFVTPTTPGAWGYAVYLYNKNVFSWDSSITKTFQIKDRGQLRIWAGAVNVLNHPDWALGSLNIQSTTFGQTTQPVNGARRIEFRGTLSF